MQVPILDDSVLEGTEGFTALLTAKDPDTVIFDTAFVTIFDNNGNIFDYELQISQLG